MQTLAALDYVARGGGHDGGPVVFKLLLLFLIGFLIAKIIRRRKGIDGYGGRGSALHTLQDRFARGEIDQAEFDHRAAVLKSKKDVPPAPARPAPPAPPASASPAPPASEPVTDTVDADDSADEPGSEE